MNVGRLVLGMCEISTENLSSGELCDRMNGIYTNY